MHLFINIYHIASLFPQHAISLIVKYLMRMANMFLTFSHNQTQQKITAWRFDELFTEGNNSNTKKVLIFIYNNKLVFIISRILELFSLWKQASKQINTYKLYICICLFI